MVEFACWLCSRTSSGAETEGRYGSEASKHGE